MCDYRLLLRRQADRPTNTRSHDGRTIVDQSDRRWSSARLEIACDNREPCGSTCLGPLRRRRSEFGRHDPRYDDTVPNCSVHYADGVDGRDALSFWAEPMQPSSITWDSSARNVE